MEKEATRTLRGESRPILFLHGGPGMSAEMERRRFGNSLPVEWWDQPRIAANAPQAFGALCDAAAEVLRERARLCGGPVPLLASSLGARVALELLNRVPEHIASFTISGGTLDPKSAFIRLARHLAISRRVQHLSGLADAAEQSASFDAVRTLLLTLFELPNLWAAYWTPSATVQLAIMGELATSGELVDIATFWAVVEDLMRHPPRFPTALPAGGGRILVGASDPFIAPDEEAVWMRWLPGVSVQTVPAGHFPHLELPVKSWLPATSF